MNLLKMLARVESIKPQELKDYMDVNQSGDYTLLDVRQENEYNAVHIPGAQLIPLSELEERLNELDPKKPIMAY